MPIRTSMDLSARAQRTINAAVAAAAQATVELWHSQMLPVHFTEEGFDKYHYQLRKGQDEPSLIYSDNGRAVRMGKYGKLVNNPAYYWRKWRQQHTHAPLVWSGESKRRAEASVQLSTRRRDDVLSASAALDLPRYFYQYRKDLNQPDKFDELQRTTPDEEATLLSYFQHKMEMEIDAASAIR